jgi:hypothetical protein
MLARGPPTQTRSRVGSQNIRSVEGRSHQNPRHEYALLTRLAVEWCGILFKGSDRGSQAPCGLVAVSAWPAPFGFCFLRAEIAM